jgi:hypothetical protein
MYLHASSVSIHVSYFSLCGDRSIHRGFQRFIKTSNESKGATRVRLTVSAPLPEEWRRICKEIGIRLDEDLLRGGVWVNGEKPEHGFIEGLEGRWLG